MSDMLKNTILKLVSLGGYEIKLSRISNSPNNQKVVFIHLAKCGGVSIDNALRTQIAKVGERKIVRSPIIKSSLFTFGRPVETIEDACDFNELHIKTLQNTLLYHLNLDWRYVSGHLAVNSKLLKAYSNEYKFITVMRDPIARFKSNYIFNKLTNKLNIMPPYSMSERDLIEEADEIIFGRRGWQMANQQTANIIGRYPKDYDDAKSLQRLFNNNISFFSVVGQLENLDSFTEDCNQKLSIDLNIKKRNQTNQGLSTEQLKTKEELENYFQHPKVARHLTKICQYEVKNYHQAQS